MKETLKAGVLYFALVFVPGSCSAPSARSGRPPDFRRAAACVSAYTAWQLTGESCLLTPARLEGFTRPTFGRCSILV